MSANDVLDMTLQQAYQEDLDAYNAGEEKPFAYQVIDEGGDKYDFYSSGDPEEISYSPYITTWLRLEVNYHGSPFMYTEVEIDPKEPDQSVYALLDDMKWYEEAWDAYEKRGGEPLLMNLCLTALSEEASILEDIFSDHPEVAGITIEDAIQRSCGCFHIEEEYQPPAPKTEYGFEWDDSAPLDDDFVAAIDDISQQVFDEQGLRLHARFKKYNQPSPELDVHLEDQDGIRHGIALAHFGPDWGLHYYGDGQCSRFKGDYSHYYLDEEIADYLYDKMVELSDMLSGGHAPEPQRIWKR